MKLLYCIHALYNAGGTERVLTEKVNYLANLPNYDIYIVTTDHKDGQPVMFSLDKKVKVIHLDLDFAGHFGANFIKKYFLYKKKIRTYKKKLIEIINLFEIDVCISLCGKEIDFLSKIDIKCKKVAEIHYSMNNRKQFIDARHNGIMWKMLGAIRTYQLQQSVKNLDRFIVLTNEDKKQWEKHCSNVIQICNPNPLKNKSVSKLENKKVITAGRLDQQKGYDMLIEAWKFVATIHPDWVLEIYGNGECKKQLEEKILNCSLEDKVYLCGVTSDIQSKYMESSFFAMSSRYEGLPMALIEAMACGLPLVSFDCEYGPRELITDGKNGFLVEPNNIKALSEKICYLIENENLRKQMGAYSIVTSQQYSLDRIMGQWGTLFTELTKQQNMKSF